MARTSKELLDLSTSLADQLAVALGVGHDGDERLTVAVVLGNGMDGGWASSVRGDEAIARLMLRHAADDAAGEFTDRTLPEPGRA